MTNNPVAEPRHVLSKRSPGSFVRIDELPKVERGIPLPDGTLLPFLNGMTFAPPIHRDPRFGPVPPVIGLSVDVGGFEWWVHADGSTTTSRYKLVQAGDKTWWDPGSEHIVPNRNTMAVDAAK